MSKKILFSKEDSSSSDKESDSDSDSKQILFTAFENQENADASKNEKDEKGEVNLKK